MFSAFFKLYEWCQITQRITNNLANLRSSKQKMKNNNTFLSPLANISLNLGLSLKLLAPPVTEISICGFSTFHSSIINSRISSNVCLFETFMNCQQKLKQLFYYHATRMLEGRHIFEKMHIKSFVKFMFCLRFH